MEVDRSACIRMSRKGRDPSVAGCSRGYSRSGERELMSIFQFNSNLKGKITFKDCFIMLSGKPGRAASLTAAIAA